MVERISVHYLVGNSLPFHACISVLSLGLAVQDGSTAVAFPAFLPDKKKTK
jgi:hypothetical protein